MNTRTLWGIVVILAVLIVVLIFVVFLAPSPLREPTATTTVSASQPATTSVSTSTQPLHARVAVTSPKKNETVGKIFVVAGQAPGPWFFEAVFPIQVRDESGNVIARAQGQAQGEWMTEGQVTFTATVNIAGNYKGPATLILLKDNPSGLPENDDSLEIQITIQ